MYDCDQQSWENVYVSETAATATVAVSSTTFLIKEAEAKSLQVSKQNFPIGTARV